MQGITVSCCYSGVLDEQRKICILLEMHSCFVLTRMTALDLRQAIHTVSILFLSGETEL